MARELEVATPNDFDVVCTRVFDAPARLVFDCHTRPALVKRWLLGPPGWSMPVCEIDLRVGGRFRYVWRNDESGREFGAQRHLSRDRRPDAHRPSRSLRRRGHARGAGHHALRRRGRPHHHDADHQLCLARGPRRGACHWHDRRHGPELRPARRDAWRGRQPERTAAQFAPGSAWKTASTVRFRQ